MEMVCSEIFFFIFEEVNWSTDFTLYAVVLGIYADMWNKQLKNDFATETENHQKID